MATDVLRELDSNVTILLVAGAPLAAGDPGLASQRAAVAQLAARSPALAKLSEQLDALTSARGRAGATELLHTAARCAQIAGAQARAAEAAGAIEPLEARAPMDTPLDSVAAARLLRVFAGKTDEPHEDLERALESGALVDLRLARPVAKIVEGDDFDNVLVTRVVRAFGEETLRPIEAAFDPKGDYDDALRVELVAAMRGAQALPLVLRAVEEGSEEVRAQALSSWSALDPAGARARCFELAASRTRSDRSAAADTLQTYHRDDGVLDLLLEMLRDDPHLWEVSHALHGLEHPGAPARLRALFTPALRDPGEYRAAKPKKGLSPAAKKAEERAEQKRAEAHEKGVRLACALLHLMGAHRTPELDELLVDAMKSSNNGEVRQAARAALVESPREDARAMLLAGLASREYAERQTAVAALMHMGPAAPGVAAPYLDPRKVAKDNAARMTAEEILDELNGSDTWAPAEAGDEAREGKGEGEKKPPLDPRWVELLVPLVALEELHFAAQRVLAQAAPDRLVALVEAALVGGDPAAASRALYGVGLLEHPRATPLLVEFMKAPGPWASVKTARALVEPLADALRDRADPATIEPLRALIAELTKRTSRGGKKHELIEPLEDALASIDPNG